MAKRAPEPPPPEPRVFRRAEEIDQAIARIERRIGDLEQLDVAAARRESNGAVDVATSSIRETILGACGKTTAEGSTAGCGRPTIAGCEEMTASRPTCLATCRPKAGCPPIIRCGPSAYSSMAWTLADRDFESSPYTRFIEESALTIPVPALRLLACFAVEHEKGWLSGAEGILAM